MTKTVFLTIKSATVSAPIFKNIAEDAIIALDIKKPSAGIEKEYRYFDTKYYTVPNVIDYDVVEARKILDKFTVEFSGTGNKVISMSPSAGSRVSEGSIIRLMLS